MNIAYLISTLERTGPTNVVFDLVSELDRTRFSPIVFTLSPEPQRSRIEDFKELDVPVRTLGMGRLAGLLEGTKTVKAALQSAHVDVCHSHGLRADLIASSLAGELPTCSTVHAVLEDDYRLGYGLYKGALVNMLHGRALRKIDTPVGCSSAVFNYLKGSLALPDAQCVKNGVSVERFRIDRCARESIRGGLGIDDDECVWIATGALIPRKNPEWLIRTWASKYGNAEKVRLLVLGSGPLMEACAAAAKPFKNVSMVGSVNNVSDYLSASDIFVSCSEAEGLPLAVLEAVASGIRCVISGIEPHLEIADNAPPGIVTFSLGSSPSFNAAADTVQTPAMSSSAALRNFACTEFSSTAMVRQYERIYQRLQK